jgi:SAM-dependent methyltransferase
MNKHGDLEYIESRKQQHELVECLIKKQASSSAPLKILEAGCGISWPFKLAGIQYFLTGVDIDSAALEIRKNTLSDLDETIEGDLCLVDLGVEQYDVIYCSNVLEHVKNADLAVKNFVKWIKPGGIIIILIPDPHSVEGFITRITPHWFHILYYRILLKDKNAGTPGHAPFPTEYHPIVSRRGMRKFCNDKSNGVDLAKEYGGTYIQPGQGAIRKLIKAFKSTMNILSLGTLSSKHSNLLYVIRKQASTD